MRKYTKLAILAALTLAALGVYWFDRPELTKGHP